MNKKYNGFEVAIIGMAGRFPKAKNLKEYWENLKKGKDCITFFSDDELLQFGIKPELLENPNYVKANGTLDDYEYFDAPFFDYSHSEAEIMDPQKRIFLEMTWNALEDAGYNPYKYEKSIGVYAGFGNTFEWEAKNLVKGDSKIDFFTASHLTNKDFTPTQISYKLNLKGPSYSVYSACSTSLVAIHNATQAILSGECDMALAGGVSVATNQKTGYFYNPDMINSPDGHCRPFDSKSAGIVGGNGGGVVVLKLLDNAISDGDHIYAIIKGSSINNDGNRKIGYTAPSVDGQTEVIKNALQLADVLPENISFVETHGTATKLGDPIEFEALRSAFSTNKKNYCALGSVKSNIGHCDSGAGVAGFIKAILCLKNRKLVPTLHFKEPNPELDLLNSPFYVNTEYKDWKHKGETLRAGVSSLGIGGTNAHVILEEYSVNDKKSEKGDRIVVLSGKTQGALERNIGNLRNYLLESPGIDLSKMAYTLQQGRQGFKYRATFVSSSVEECSNILNKEVSGRIKYGYLQSKDKPVVFMYSGQGSQYINMGKELYENEQVFNEELSKCFKILNDITGEDLTNFLYPKTEEDKLRNESKLYDMLYSGPIKFSFEYALSKLLMYFGVEPDVYIGHSFGEYVAATLSGVIKLEDALKLSVIRGRLMHKSPKGAMMNIPLSEGEIVPYLNEKISLAAVNTSTLCIVSGKREDLEELSQRLSNNEVECMILNVPRGGHSYLMDEILEEFECCFAGIKLNPPNKTYISGMLGRETKDSEITDPKYWISHIRNKVNYSDGISYICEQYSNALFIEVSPGKGLCLFVENNESKKETHSILNMIKHYNDLVSDKRYFYEKLGSFWLEGLDVKWDNLYKTIPGRISLPGYSFDKYLYKAEGSLTDELSKVMTGLNPFGSLKRDYVDWFYVPSWRRENRLKDSIYIKPNKNYLLFSLGTVLEDNIKHNLTENGCFFKEVKIGDKYNKISDCCYEIDYRFKEEFTELIKDVIVKGFNIDNIIYLWSCYERSNEDASFEDIKYAEYICFRSIVNIIQSLAENECNNKIKLIITTSNMESVNGTEQIYYEKSLITGLLKTIPLEFENLECKLIDVTLNDLSKESIAKNLLNIIYNDSKIKIINIIRDNYVWFKYYEKIRLEENNKDIINFDNKNILIIGGLTGIGYEIALDLAKKHENIHLVLMGRSAIPNKIHWDKILSEKENDNLKNRINNLKLLENENAKITYLQCDISDDKKLFESINKIELCCGEISIVLNSAGVPVGGSIVGITDDKIFEEFSSKVIGTFNLINIFKSRIGMDAFVNFSSITAILSGFGQSCYASANSFEDYLSTHYFNKGFNICSINWDRWLQTGMSINVEKRHKDETGENLEGMSSEEGLKALHDILGNKIPNVLTSMNDLNAMLEAYEKRKDTTDREIIVAQNIKYEVKMKNNYPRPSISVEYVEPKTEIEINLTKLYIDFFKYDKIGIDDNFFELGGDSLKAMSLSNFIRKTIIVKIPISMFFKYPTIKTLSLYIEELLAIDSVFGNDKRESCKNNNSRGKIRV